MTLPRSVFRAIATSVVPEATQLDTVQWDEVERIVTRATDARPPTVRRQLALYVALLEWLPVLRYGRRFSKLDAGHRTRWLDRLQHSRVLLVRRGFWGIRTLVLMGYYGRLDAAAAIGYRAHPRGWEARR